MQTGDCNVQPWQPSTNQTVRNLTPNECKLLHPKGADDASTLPRCRRSILPVVHHNGGKGLPAVQSVMSTRRCHGMLLSYSALLRTCEKANVVGDLQRRSARRQQRRPWHSRSRWASRATRSRRGSSAASRWPPSSAWTTSRRRCCSARCAFCGRQAACALSPGVQQLRRMLLRLQLGPSLSVQFLQLAMGSEQRL